MTIYNHKNLIFLLIFFYLNNASYILSGIKTLNNFLYLSRYKKFYKQNKTTSCSFIDGPNCYFTEKNYLFNFNQFNEKENVIFEDWNKSLKNSEKYGLNNIYFFYRKKTKEYLIKNSNKIDFGQNSQGEAFTYLLTFDYFDQYTIVKDIFFEENIKKTFYNQEFIIEIKGKLKLSYDKDETEEYLRQIYPDYPSKTYGIIDSKFISISFQGKLFICKFLYIRPHDEKSKKEIIYFTGYVGKQAMFIQSYIDIKKRKEKWIKVYFRNFIPINILMISGPYDIDNLSFTFLNKHYDDSNLYKNNNNEIVKLIKDEDI